MHNSDFEKIMLKCKKRLTRARAIKIYCKELCSNGDIKSWADCTFTNCPLWRFRKGKEILTTGTPLSSSSAKNIRKIRGFSSKNNAYGGEISPNQKTQEEVE